MKPIRSCTLLISLVLATCVLSQDGANDPTFNPDDLGFGQGDGANATVRGVLVQPDDMLLIWGDLTVYNFRSSNRVCRLNSDGTPDITFNKPTQNGDVFAVALQPDGKMVVGGDFTYVESAPYQRIMRLNVDGTVDQGFIPVGNGVNDRVNAIGLQPDGKVIIAGAFTQFNSAIRNRILRVGPTGALDATFTTGAGADGPINAVAVQPDGKILIAGDFLNYAGVPRAGIARLTSTGALDPTFDPGAGASGMVNTIHLQADGSMIIAGGFSLFDGEPRGAIAKLNVDGSLDMAFDPNGGADNFVFGLAVQADGKVIIGGEFNSVGGAFASRITRLNSDGSIDPTFSPVSGADSTVFGIAVKADGRLVVVGDLLSYDGVTRERVVQLASNGTLDPQFNYSTGADDLILTVLVLDDDRILIGGRFEHYNGEPRNHIACLNADGTIDPTFQIGSGADGWVHAIVQQSDGKFLVAGGFMNYQGTPRNMVVRLNSDGSVDSGFNVPIGGFGNVFDVIVRPDGKIILGGAFYNLGDTGINSIALLEPDGTIDETFNTGLAEATFGIALQTDGKLIHGNYTVPRLRRMNADGTPDPSFDAGTGPNDQIEQVILQPDGKILIVGGFLNFNEVYTGSVVRLLADGSLDPAFDTGDGPGGAFGHTDAVSLLADGRILVGGNFSEFDNDERNGVTRLLASGAQDDTFDPGVGTGGPSTLAVTGFGIQSDGRTIMVGGFTSYDGAGRNRIARITTDINTGALSRHAPTINATPNPTSGVVTISGSFSPSSRITILDALGRTVDEINSNSVSNGRFTVDLSGEASGLYSVRCQSAQGTSSLPLVKE